MKIWVVGVLLLGCGQVTATSDVSQGGRSGGGRGGHDDQTPVPSDAGGGRASAGTPATSSTGGSSGSDDPSMIIGGLPAQAGEAAGGAAGGAAGEGNDRAATLPSSGCFKDPPATQISSLPSSRTGYTEFFVDQTGATLGADQPQKAGARQFFVRLPPDYDNSRAYRVVYVMQGCGALRAGKTNTYALFNELDGGSEDAVYVGVSVPDNDANPGCFDNNSGALSQEWEAFELMHDFVESTYCIDNQRIFAAGYSTGGWVSNMWGCYFGGTPSPERKFAPKWALRGHAAVAAALPPNQPKPCSGPAAGFWLHDELDKSTLLATDVAALELQLQTNGCVGSYADGPAEPWAPAANFPGLADGACRKFTGCPADISQRYPLVFCTTTGEGHSDQPKNAIPLITRFFESMDPTP